MNIVSVREIVAALTEPVNWETRFLPERAELGRQAHKNYTASENASVEREVDLRAEFITAAGEVIAIRGRIDLIVKQSHQITISEIKSVVLPPPQFKQLTQLPPRYILQAQIYAWLFSKNLPPSAQDSVLPVRCELCLVNLTEGDCRSLPVTWSPQDVEADLERFQDYRSERAARDFADARRRRLLAGELAWFYPNYREGQRDVIQAVRQAWQDKCDLLLEAPPGFGKTAAMVFGALQQSLAQGGRLFYATAKGGGQNPVRQSVQALRQRCPQLRVLFLSARESLCPYELECFSGEECPLRRLDSIHPEVSRTWPEFDQKGTISFAELQDVGQKYRICPRTLAESVIDWADLTVGDYNFVFAPDARLECFRQPKAPSWYLLVDEAHNLTERVAANFSIELQQEQIDNLIQNLREEEFRFSGIPAYTHLQDILQELLFRMNGEAGDNEERNIAFINPQESFWNKIVSEYGRAAAEFMLAAEGRLEAPVGAALLQVYNDLIFFASLLNEDREAFPAFYDMDKQSMGIRCLDPGLKIGEMFSKFRGVAVFSGTLSPLSLWPTVLGFGARPVRNISIDAAKVEARRLVVLAPGVDTRFKVRPRSVQKACAVISDFIRLHRGGYLVVFPSYEYIELALPHLQNLQTWEADILVQRREMPYAERFRLRKALERRDRTSVALVVAGGQFTEAEDYPGDACVGVVVVSPCLPPPDYWREELQAYWERRGEDGRTLAYYAPAVRRVVQAGGRLLRNETDRGVALLLDDRFLAPEFFNLLPRAWQNGLSQTSPDWKEQVERFWSA